jgi:cytochrome c553
MVLMVRLPVSSILAWPANTKNGERRGTMNALAADLTDDEITALAEYFNQKPALKHRIHDEEFAAVGKYIFHQGNKFSTTEVGGTA